MSLSVSEHIEAINSQIRSRGDRKVLDIIWEYIQANNVSQDDFDFVKDDEHYVRLIEAKDKTRRRGF